ncbi:MAG: TerC/Alx family metal homeostasis membrane protein [Gemmatimonadales bacterium]|nr:TerC/Alx family metal homeostasis membrane protein [Gemmatimonadales bacterium]
MGEHDLTVWLGFTGLVVALLVLDLGVLNRRSHVLSFKEAMSWSGGLIAFALLFGLFLLWREGTHHALEYYTGYLIELSLSVDNLFVFILIFSYFGVPADAQPKVLKWGILGAIVMRLVMILAGSLLLAEFEWIVFVFGGILIVTGIRMVTQKDDQIEPEKNPLVRLARRVLPVSGKYDGANFITHGPDGRWMATPLLLVLLVVEWSDLIFAIDSIPAIFAVTRDPFLVYSSNVFAILGLRALFFVLSGMIDKFVYLKPGVAAILVFVGAKMTLSHWVHLPTLASLVVIVLTLTVAVLLSMRRNAREAREGRAARAAA